jgi:hypothetical protein
MIDLFEHINESPGSIKDTEALDQLNNYKLFKEAFRHGLVS